MQVLVGRNGDSGDQDHEFFEVELLVLVLVQLLEDPVNAGRVDLILAEAEGRRMPEACAPGQGLLSGTAVPLAQLPRRAPAAGSWS